MLTNLANKHGPTKTRKQRVTSVKTWLFVPRSPCSPKLRNLPQHRIAGITTGFTHQFVETVRQELVGQKGLTRAGRLHPRWRWNGRLLKSPAPLENNVFFLYIQTVVVWDWDELKHQKVQQQAMIVLLFCFLKVLIRP